VSVRWVVMLVGVAGVALVGYGIFHERPLSTPRQCKDLYDLNLLEPQRHPECYKPPLNVWSRLR
jgi:hypothetical protein